MPLSLYEFCPSSCSSEPKDDEPKNHVCIYKMNDAKAPDDMMYRCLRDDCPAMYAGNELEAEGQVYLPYCNRTLDNYRQDRIGGACTTRPPDPKCAYLNKYKRPTPEVPPQASEAFAKTPEVPPQASEAFAKTPVTSPLQPSPQPRSKLLLIVVFFLFLILVLSRML